MRLASGGLCDAKGKGTSDVDISILNKDYDKLENIFKGFKI